MSALSLAKISQEARFEECHLYVQGGMDSKGIVRKAINPELSFATSGIILIIVLQNKTRGFPFREGGTGKKSSSFSVRTKN